jgi:hypothetical protein
MSASEDDITDPRIETGRCDICNTEADKCVIKKIIVGNEVFSQYLHQRDQEMYHAFKEAEWASIIKSPSDGTCSFHALCYQLVQEGLLPKSVTGPHLRQLVCEYVNITYPEDQLRQQWVEKMKSDGAWMDEKAMLYICDMYKVQITSYEVLKPYAKNWEEWNFTLSFFGPDECYTLREGEEYPTLHLLHYHQTHFDVLVPTPGMEFSTPENLNRFAKSLANFARGQRTIAKTLANKNGTWNWDYINRSTIVMPSDDEDDNQQLEALNSMTLSDQLLLSTTSTIPSSPMDEPATQHFIDESHDNENNQSNDDSPSRKTTSESETTDCSTQENSKQKRLNSQSPIKKQRKKKKKLHSEILLKVLLSFRKKESLM